jgi:broad specificity phosphatase PhoE
MLLARHGQSTWNADGRWQGRADPPLSELGERQAEDAVTVLRDRADAGLTIDRIWASPLARARRTAEIIGAGFGLGVATDPRLQEVDAGEWTGMTREEIDAAWPDYLTEHRRPPGFETHEHLLARALEALGAIAGSTAGQTVLVVTHGGVIGAVERHFEVEWLRIPNLGGREVFWGADGLVLGDVLMLVDPDDVEVTTPTQI